MSKEEIEEFYNRRLENILDYHMKLVMENDMLSDKAKVKQQTIVDRTKILLKKEPSFEERDFNFLFDELQLIRFQEFKVSNVLDKKYIEMEQEKKKVKMINGVIIDK